METTWLLVICAISILSFNLEAHEESSESLERTTTEAENTKLPEGNATAQENMTAQADELKQVGQNKKRILVVDLLGGGMGELPNVPGLLSGFQGGMTGLSQGMGGFPMAPQSGQAGFSSQSFMGGQGFQQPWQGYFGQQGLWGQNSGTGYCTNGGNPVRGQNTLLIRCGQALEYGQQQRAIFQQCPRNSVCDQRSRICCSQPNPPSSGMQNQNSWGQYQLGQNQFSQNPWSQNSGGQNQFGQNQFSQNPWNQNSAGQNPWTQTEWAQNQWSQNPISWPWNQNSFFPNQYQWYPGYNQFGPDQYQMSNQYPGFSGQFQGPNQFQGSNQPPSSQNPNVNVQFGAGRLGEGEPIHQTDQPGNQSASGLCYADEVYTGKNCTLSSSKLTECPLKSYCRTPAFVCCAPKAKIQQTKP